MLRNTLMATVALAALVGGAHAAELKVGAANVPATLDPGKDHSNSGSQFYYNSFDTLIEKDHTTGEPKFLPGLATSWQMVDDTTMEFKLRQDVTFQNGEEMTADDVVFSFNRMLQATFPPYQVRSKDRLSNFESAEKIDDYTVRVHARRAEPLWETLINMQQLMIVPEDYIKALSGDPAVAEDSDYEAFSLAPIGTGPYKIAEFVPEQRLVWERYDGFWGDAAPFEKVTVRRIPEMATRITALKNGEVDLITNLPPDQLQLVESDPDLKVEGMVTPLFHVLIYNTQNETMANPKLRQALNYAIDRDTLNEALWLGKAVVPSTHTMEEFGPLYMPDLETFKYDLEKAKTLLAESGYDGETIRIDTSASYYTNGLLAMQAIAEMWSQIGVKTEINVNDAWTGGDPTMNARNWSNPMYFADPFGSFGVMWAPGGPAEGEGRFKTDADYAEKWERFRFSSKVEERRQAYGELMERIKQDPPFLVLYRPYESWGMRKDVDWAPMPGHIPYVLDFRAGSIGVQS
ncbi:ABC transporter substrate-binding protein [Aurantimonas sp. A3-2-R12]|uniref:ABC transporter substrate-binding protein n=1 Tax=Aurantimonas sp. A3-2-R12 TaxID=3114362 RepID=UPI002E1812BE|nr:ABC transporter substrate-binding protein [Aurantimonas sp. A3-2-R12]